MAEGPQAHYISFDDTLINEPVEKETRFSDVGEEEDSLSPFREDPFAFIYGDIWSKRKSFKRSTIKLTTSKEIQRYIKKAGNNDKALLKVISETDSTKFPEARVGLFVTELLQKGAKVTAMDTECNTPLHLAAERGYTEVAKELLRWGADPHRKNSHDKVPLEISVHKALEVSRNAEDNVNDYNSFCVLMCNEMEPYKVRSLFVSEVGKEPQLNFHSLLKAEQLQDTVNAVLDTLIEKVPGRKRTFRVYYDLLESNKHGQIVRAPNKLSLRRKLGKSAFDLIAWSGNKEAVTHLVVQLMIQSKWKRFARNFLILHFLYWAVTMIMISTALIVAALERDPQVYDEPVDFFRAVCEGVAIFLLLCSSLTEVYHIYLWRLDYFRDYSFFLYSYLNLLTALFVIVLIPLRVTGQMEQWLFASFTYVCYSMRLLQFVGSIKILGKYIQILILIIRRDLFPFVTILLVVLFIYTGGFYFALREEQSYIENGNLTENFVELGSYERVFFTGIRIAIEGQNFLNYFGPDATLRWLGVTTYLIFLFTLEVIMLNLLIAQMSDTFSNVQGDAQRSFAISRARTVISIERTGVSFLKCLTDFYQSEELWANPQKYVERLDMTSITNIHCIVIKTQRIANQTSSALDDLRDTTAEQNLATLRALETIREKLENLESSLKGRE